MSEIKDYGELNLDTSIRAQVKAVIGDREALRLYFNVIEAYAIIAQEKPDLIDEDILSDLSNAIYLIRQAYDY